MSAGFFARVQPLICFSRAIASVGEPNASIQIKREMLYLEVKPGSNFC